MPHPSAGKAGTSEFTPLSPRVTSDPVGGKQVRWVGSGLCHKTPRFVLRLDQIKGPETPRGSVNAEGERELLEQVSTPRWLRPRFVTMNRSFRFAEPRFPDL